MDNTNNNLIDFSRFTPRAQNDIDRNAAKEYFIRQVLPYVSGASLERLITASIYKDPQSLRLEMLRMYIEAELAKPNTSNPTNLQAFFTE